ncbi:hypothetical protein ABGB18_28440 [Nonomuraea sp. B12E4]|uniref:hypothetical protein n=1 Tax=Nonomuraea sp. B12E4 TaxID=3153564 RepID=UPI00325D0FA6
MSRIVSALGAVVAAGMLITAAPTAAHAANGVLLINGEIFIDPSGCYPSDRWPLEVRNHTDQVALIFDTPDCTGSSPELVFPDQSTISEFGSSVYIH